MNQEHTSDRRETILSAAARVFHAHGYAATTMEQVALQAGISKGSTYTYFKSKKDLFTQLFERVLSASEAESQERLGELDSATAKLECLLDDALGRPESYTGIGGLVLEFWSQAAREERGELATHLGELFQRSRERIAGIVEQGIRQGEFVAEVRPTVAASLILSIINGALVQAILDVGIRIDEDFLTALKRSVLAALKAPRPAGAPGEATHDD